jgi:hypothetical protein
MEKENPFDMLQVVARRNLQAAWVRVAAAVILVMAGMTWFWATYAGTVNLVAYVVAIIIAYLIIASQVRNLSHARTRARKL